MMGIIAILVYVSTLRSFGVPYLTPLVPTKRHDLKDVLVRALWWAMNPTLIGTAILYLPSGMAAAANNDLWISPVFASVLGFLNVHVADRLHRLYAKQTIIEYSEHIVGRVRGKILGRRIASCTCNEMRKSSDYTRILSRASS